MIRRNTLLLIILSLICLGGWWFLNQHLSKSAQTTDDSSAPEAFMSQISDVHLNQEGQVNSQMSATSVKHFANNNLTLFTHPDIQLYDNDHNAWHITADYGQSLQGSHEIKLLENILVIHKPGLQAASMRLKTDRLTYYPEEKLTVTNDPVIITQSNSVTHAIGMRANLKKGTLTLLSNVRTTYVPKAASKTS